MADLYIPQNPAVLRAPGPAKPPAEQAREAVQTATFASEIEAATAFQKHLDKGYQGMVEVFQALPPEVQAVAGDPGAYSDSEEKRLDWYFRVNEQMTKAQAMSQAQAGDFAGADATATAGPMSKQARQDTQDFALGRRADKADADLQGLVKQGPAAAAGASIPGGEISPKSPLGRTLKIVSGKLASYQDVIAAAAAKHGVPESLIKAVITRESRGNPKAQPYDKSGKLRSSAKGLMQLIDGTAKRFGVTDAFDPGQNVDGGTQYLKFLRGRYGDPEKAVAAYHEGEGAFDTLLKEKGENWRDGLSPDAKDYVPDVMTYLKGYGGGTFAAGEVVAPTQSDVVKQFIEANPDILERPGGKALLDAMRVDASLAIRETGEDGKQARFDASQSRLKDAASQKAYQTYAKQIEREGAAANAILEIDRAVGGLDDETKPLPGLGAGMKSLRKFMMSDATPEADAMRILFSNLFADIGLAASGQNFTKAEMDRLEERMRASNMATAASVRRALRSQRDKIYQQIANKFSAMPEDAQQAAIEDETINPTMFGEFTTLSGQKRKYGQASAKAEPEAPGLDEAKAARLKELRAKKAAGTLGKAP
jgi:soluble lytic murein transglycosylase-like protein